MKQFRLLILGLWTCLLVATSQAEVFQLTDGTTIDGEILKPAKADFLQIKRGDNDYVKVPWEKLSQETLKRLAEDQTLAQFAKPLIEVPDDEKLKRTEVIIKDPERLARPVKSSVIGGLFGSSVGLLAIFLIYVANIYAGYEIAIVRAYPPVMVCGIAAVAPFVGPIIFLFLPTKLASATETTLVEAAEATQAHAEGVHQTAQAHAAATGHGAPQSSAATATAEAAAPQQQIFKRGQFTFNKRFVETKFPGFFGVVRHGADKDLVLVVKTPRGTHTATRISRVAAHDMHVETSNGEVMVPFGEIQELIIKHKDH